MRLDAEGRHERGGQCSGRARYGCVSVAHQIASMMTEVVLPARFLTEDQAVDIVKRFLDTSFEGGRHARRVDKIEVHGEVR